MKFNYKDYTISAYILTLLLIINSQIQGQVCDPAGNVIIYSNYEGGTLNINVDENIPNLKLGIVTYESPVVNIGGAFAGNITEVIYAGFGDDGSCTGNPTVQINGVDPSIITIYTNEQPAISPYLGDPIAPGFPALVNCITSGGDCTTNSSSGGNSANQIVQFFLFEFSAPAVFRYHFTQYDCWSNLTVNTTEGGNCCLSAPTTPLNPIYQSGATYNLIEETEFSLCDGDVTVSIPYEVLFQPPIYPGYVWSNGETGSTVTFTQPGTYSVSVGDYCHFGSNGFLVDQITILPCTNDFVVTLTPDQSICAGESTLIEASISGGTGPYTFFWSPSIGIGAGPHTVSPSTTTTYSLLIIDSNGEEAEASTTITVIEENLTLDLGTDLDLCNGSVVINAFIPGAISYEWSTGSAAPSITVNQPGTYSVIVSGECETVEDEIIVTDCPPPFNVNLGGPFTICPGESIFISANVSGGTAPYTYLWTPALGAGPGPFAVSPSSTTVYSVTVTDALGEITQNSTTVTVITQVVTVDLGEDTDLCNGTVLLNATTPGATGYAWNTGQSTPSINVTMPGFYSVLVSGPCNEVTDEVEIGICIPPLVVTLGDDLSVCAGEQFVLQAVVEGGVPPYSYTWSPSVGSGAGPFNLSATGTSSYIVTVTDSDGNAAADQILITVNEEIVDIELGPDRLICTESGEMLSAFSPNAISYLWNTGDTTASITPFNAGIYWVSALGICNIDTDTIEVNLQSNGLPDFPRVVRFCEGDTAIIGPALSSDYTVIWSDGLVGAQIQVVEEAVYTAQVTGQCGTTTFSVSTEKVNCSCDVFVPNAFTPSDNNGTNDLFGPVSECDFYAYEFLIFNRWGELIFESKDPLKKWNGASADEGYFGQNAVYVWVLKVQQQQDLLISNPFELSGTVQVIR